MQGRYPSCKYDKPLLRRFAPWPSQYFLFKKSLKKEKGNGRGSLPLLLFLPFLFLFSPSPFSSFLLFFSPSRFLFHFHFHLWYNISISKKEMKDSYARFDLNWHLFVYFFSWNQIFNWTNQFESDLHHKNRNKILCSL